MQHRLLLFTFHSWIKIWDYFYQITLICFIAPRMVITAMIYFWFGSKYTCTLWVVIGLHLNRWFLYAAQGMFWCKNKYICLRRMATPPREITDMEIFTFLLGLLLKERICSLWEQILSFKSSPHFWKVSCTKEWTSCFQKLSPFAKIFQLIHLP